MINPDVKDEELNKPKKHIQELLYSEGKPNINSTSDINTKVIINVDEFIIPLHSGNQNGAVEEIKELVNLKL